MSGLAGATALVTGGAGTIGSTLVDQLLTAGVARVDVLDNFVRGRRGNLEAALADPRTRIVEGDIRDRDLVHDLTAGKDLVFHQAAIRITQCAEEPRLALEVLVDGTFNVVEAAAAHGVDKLVAASSASVYGMAEIFPTGERHHHHNNDTFYGAAKSFNEGMIRSFRAMSGLDYVVLRYFNVYGPRMDVHGLYTEVLVRWMERIVDGEPPLIFGDGRQTMDFAFTTDIARANILAAASEVREGVYNVASGHETSLLELARTLLEVMELGPRGPARSRAGRERRRPSTRRRRGRSGGPRLRRRGAGGRGTGPSRGVVATAAGRGGRGSAAGGSLMSRIHVMQPWLGEEEAEAAVAAIRSGWVAQGPRVAEFEGAFGARQQAEHAVAVSSCTAALHLALVVAGVGEGDEVVVPSLSFVATANAPMYVGARPVFADVDATTGNLTAETVAAAITPRTRAVIVVDQAGVPADLEPIQRLCEPRGIEVVEDAACAAGSTYRSRPVGAEVDLVAWSFHPRKLLTTGEGGMLTSRSGDLAARARRLREHAMSASAAARHQQVLTPPEEYGEVGFNYRMTDLQAAVGLVQLAKLDEMVARRRELAATYAKTLAETEGLRIVADPPHGTTNFQSCWIEVEPGFPLDREQLLERLAEAEISARRGIMAAHLHPAHADRARAGDLVNTERLTHRTLVLPLYHLMSESEQSRVIDVLRAAGAGR